MLLATKMPKFEGQVFIAEEEKKEDKLNRHKWSCWYLTWNPNKRFPMTPTGVAYAMRFKRHFSEVLYRAYTQNLHKYVIFGEWTEGERGKKRSMETFRKYHGNQEAMFNNPEIVDLVKYEIGVEITIDGPGAGSVHSHSTLKIGHRSNITLDYNLLKKDICEALGIDNIYSSIHPFADSSATLYDYIHKHSHEKEENAKRLVEGAPK